MNGSSRGQSLKRGSSLSSFMFHGDLSGDYGNDFNSGGNCGDDEQDTVEHLSSRYPMRN